MKQGGRVFVLKIAPDRQGPLRIVIEGPIDETHRLRTMDQDVVEFAEDLSDVLVEQTFFGGREAVRAEEGAASRRLIIDGPIP